MRRFLYWFVLSLAFSLYFISAQEDDLDFQNFGGLEGDEEGQPNFDIEELMAKYQQGDLGGGFGEGFGGNRRFNRDIFAVEEDVPYVQCETCHQLVKELVRRVEERKSRLKKTKLKEFEVLEMLEGICTPMEGTGDWISEFDIVEKDDKLILERKNSPGYCEEECKTIAKACQNILDLMDAELSEMVYLAKPGYEDKICSKMIKELKGACGESLPPLPADRVPGGDNFKPKSDVDIALAEASKELRKKQEMDPQFLDRDQL